MEKVCFPYILAIVCIACGGIPKGYDEGGFSASINLPSFVADYGLDPTEWTNNPAGLASRKANITSFGVLGTAFGALLALLLADRFGRLKCWRGFLLLWASGLFIQVFASGILGLLLVSRIWLGLGAGGLTVVSPLFLSEIAPAKSRGLVVSVFMMFLLGFLSIGFFVNYGASLHMAPTREQYRLVQSVPLIPTGLAFIGSFWLRESPRWLAAQERVEEAHTSLRRYRGTDADSTRLAAEVAGIQEQLSTKEEALKGASTVSIIKEVLTVPTYRRRLVLAVTMQTVAQWSGGAGLFLRNSLSKNIFEYAGVGSTSTALVSSGAYGIVKLVFTLVFALALVDFFGRRFCFIAGLILEFVAHLYLFFYTLLLSSKGEQAASDVAILVIFLYAVGWSIGLCTVQYIYATEVFPNRFRGVCYSFNMALHWFFQFAVVRVIPSMMVGLHVWGGFLFFALVCAIGLVLLWLMAPETNRVPLEKMDDLFAGPWYTGWKARARSDASIDPDEALDGDKVQTSKAHVERLA